MCATPAGFLLELYELSQRYKLPNVEFALYVGDQVRAGPAGTSSAGVQPLWRWRDLVHYQLHQ